MKYIIDFIKKNLLPLLVITVIGITYLIRTNIEPFYNSEETKRNLIVMRQLRPDLFYSNSNSRIY